MTQPVTITPPILVQEQSGPAWAESPNSAVPFNFYQPSTNNVPSLKAGHAKVIYPSWYWNCLWGNGYLDLSLNDCEFYCSGVLWQMVGSDSPSSCFINNLFVYPQILFESTGQFVAHNNTFIGDTGLYTYFVNNGLNVWTNQDNAFDNCDTYMDGVIGYNAYVNGATLESPRQPSDIVTNLTWLKSWLGNFYQSVSSPLIQSGSTNANYLGLYHFTTQTNKVPETNSVVTIGYHYVATDTNGLPLDTNGDGIPDYIEDANGNGMVDSDEIGWNIFGDEGLLIYIRQPLNRSTVP